MDSHVPRTTGEAPSLLGGIDTTLRGLVRLVPGTPPPALVSGLQTIASHVAAAQKQFELDGPFATAPSLLAGLTAVRSLRAELANMGLPGDARFDLDARLKTKEDQFTEGAVLAHGLRVEVLADDGIIVPGQNVRVSISVGDRGRPVSVSSVALDGFAAPAKCPGGSDGARLEVGAVYASEATVPVPVNAKITRPHWKRRPDVERRIRP
jgi:acetylornithine deacetylase/succinyl-diaminopimelate desuccinylase-like protein